MKSLLDGAGRRVRAGWQAERFSPTVGPAVRATLALVVPLAVARTSGRVEVGMWAGLAAFNLTLAGNEGPYRLRLGFMGRGLALLAVAVFAGSLAGTYGWLAAVAVGVAAAVAGWVGAAGPSAAAPGIQMAILLLLASARPVPVAAAGVRALEVAAGGGWAMLMALVLWPARPYQPLYRAVAAAWRAAAGLLEAAADLPLPGALRDSGDGAGPGAVRHMSSGAMGGSAGTAAGTGVVRQDGLDGGASATAGVGSIRQEGSGGDAGAGGGRRDSALRGSQAALRGALEEAWGALAAGRSLTQGTSPTGEALVVLTRIASRAGAAAAAMAALVPRTETEREALHDAGAAAASASRAVAAAVAAGGREQEVTALLASLDRFGGVARSLHRTSLPADHPAGGTENPPGVHLDAAQVAAPEASMPGDRAGAPATLVTDDAAAALANLDELLGAAAEALAGLRRPAPRAVVRDLAWLGGHPAPLFPGEGAVGGGAALHSVRWRHALRLGVAAAVGVGLARAVALPRGYWVALTVIVVLQPDFGATLVRARQRVLGTVGGGAVGGSVLALHAGPWLIDGLLVASCFVFALLRRRAYSWAVAFLTIMLVMLLDSFGPVGWDLVAARAGANLIGGVLAVAAGYLLWPRWERRRLAEALAAALRADAAFLHEAAAALAGGAGTTAAVVAARRRAEVAAADAAASYQRMLSEPAHQQRDVALGLALVTYADRLTRALTALTFRLPALDAAAAPPGLADFAGAAVAALTELAAATESGAPLAPLTTAGGAGAAPPDPALAAGPIENPAGASIGDLALVRRLLSQAGREITEMRTALRSR